jgi:hypothetical protein
VGRSERKDGHPVPGSRKGKDYGSVVGHLVSQLIDRHPSFSANPLGDWKDLVGEQVARYCQPQSLNKKVLTVAAYDSVWKHHLELLKEALTEKINRGRPESLVEKIIVRVCELPEGTTRLTADYRSPRQSGAGKTGERRRRKTPARQLTADEKAFLKDLQDPDLRALGTRLLKRTPLESE